MSLTMYDIARKLEQQPEISILEVLEISSEDLVDRFMDRIEEKFDYLHDDFLVDHLDNDEMDDFEHDK